jgi:DMSO/TMAO reductase YedYZ molybdopterin-dependent catalytic subunit
MVSWRVGVAAWALGFALAARAAGVTEQLQVVGAVKTPLTLDVAQLRDFPPDSIGTVTVTRRVDGQELASTVRGVRLTAVLNRAGLVEADHNSWKHAVVLATASDGYSVAFSWPELTNTEVGSAVLVVFERDGQPLADREGRIALLSARDQRSGPRSVRWLARLSVRVLSE